MVAEFYSNPVNILFPRARVAPYCEWETESYGKKEEHAMLVIMIFTATIAIFSTTTITIATSTLTTTTKTSSI